LEFQKLAHHEGGTPWRSGRAWWRVRRGAWRPASDHGDAIRQRVSRCCVASPRAHAAPAAARARVPCAERARGVGAAHALVRFFDPSHRQRRAPILGASCSPILPRAFWGTRGANACAPRPWGIWSVEASPGRFRARLPQPRAPQRTCAAPKNRQKSRCLRTTTLCKVWCRRPMAV
jgi:hypothetical protein